MVRIFNSLAVVAATAVTPVWSLCSHNTFLHPRATEGGETVEVKKFGYTGVTGPLFWSSLAPENTICSTGTRQSPIDMKEGSFNMMTPADVQVDIPDFTEGTEFENLGTTIEVIAKGGSLTLGEKQYSLKQFHFHLPSEHLDNGTIRAISTPYPYISLSSWFIDVATEAGPELVIPPIVAAPSNETAGTASVPSRFRFRRSSKTQRRQEAVVPPTNETTTAPVQDAPVSGAPTVLLETIFSTIDAIKTPGAVTQTPPLVLSEVVNIWKAGQFQGYSGSLTTPPCSEGVSWLVSTQTLRISAVTFEKVRSVIGFNSRITQNAPGQDNILAMAAVRQLNVFASSGAAALKEE